MPHALVLSLCFAKYRLLKIILLVLYDYIGSKEEIIGIRERGNLTRPLALSRDYSFDVIACRQSEANVNGFSNIKLLTPLTLAPQR